jgi:hypothetical protein
MRQRVGCSGTYPTTFEFLTKTSTKERQRESIEQKQSITGEIVIW